MCLHNEIMDHACTPLDPLLCIFSENPAVSELSVLVIPAEDVLREVLHCDTCIFLELLLREFAEIGSDSVITYAVENESVNLRILACELLQDFNLIFLHLRIRRIHHAVVVGLDLGDRRKLAVVVAYRLPCGLVDINDTAVEIIVSAGKDIEGAEYLEAHLMSVLDEISEHVIVTRAGHAFPIAHIRSDLAVIKHLAHDGLHIDNDIAESEVLALAEVELYRVRMRKGRIVGLTVKPHIIVINFLIISLISA